MGDLLILFTLLLAFTPSAVGFYFPFPVATVNNETNFSLSASSLHTSFGNGSGRLIQGVRLVPSEAATDFWLGIDRGQVKRFAAGVVSLEAPGSGINDSPIAVTFDSTASRQVVATRAGLGSLHQRSESGQWSQFADLAGEQLDSFVYFPSQDVFFGLRIFKAAPGEEIVLLKYNATGQKIDELKFPALPMKIGPGEYHSELHVFNGIIILMIERPQEAAAGLSWIYLIDPVARTIVKTHEAPVPPQVKFLFPATNSVFPYNSTIDLKFQINDSDFKTIDVKANSASLYNFTKVEYTHLDTNIHTYTKTWRPSPGEYTLTAHATDYNGFAADAPTVRVTIRPPEPLGRLQFNTPLDSTQFLEGTNVLIFIQATDAPFTNVVLYADNKQLIDFPRPPPYTLPQTFGYLWRNPPRGEHQFRAVGFNASGLSTSSPPIHIHVVSQLSPPISAERSLPDLYIPGQKFSVSLWARLRISANAWAVEEQPPENWLVSEISNNGVYDPVNQKIKWGPFTDRPAIPPLNDTAAVLFTYNVAAPNSAAGEKNFSGSVFGNNQAFEIGGDKVVLQGMLYYPADEPPADGRLTALEVTSYAAAWKTQTPWPRPPEEIPIDFVTRAGFLWRSGETYAYNATLPPPASWHPSNNLAKATSLGTTERLTIRSLLPAFSPGQLTRVTLRIKPPLNTQSYALEDHAPEGWQIIDPAGGALIKGGLRFGPYFDSQERELSYTLISPTNAMRGDFSGVVSFDGSHEQIAGANTLSPPSLSAASSDARNIRLRLNATPGERFALESTDNIESNTWDLEQIITGAESPVEIPPFPPSAALKFYRLRPQ